MTTIDSSTSGSTGRITGIVSGLDTDSLVKDLTIATQLKIAKANQNKQILEWKQQDYRTILEKLFNFNKTYFGSSYSKMTIGDQLSRLTATSSNNAYVTAVAGDSATAGSVYINDIISMAKAAKLSGAKGISPDLAFTLNTDNLASLGGTSMNVTLDGSEKTLTFSASKTYSTADDVVNELNSLLEDAFGSGRVAVSAADGTLKFSAANNSILKIADSGNAGYESLAVLGFTDTDISQNRLDLNKKLADYPSLFGSEPVCAFSINGTDFSFDNNTTLNKIISTINSSAAGVQIAYSNITDSFTITANETGTGSAVEIADSTGSFLNAILGGSGTLSAGVNAVVSLSLDGSTDGSNLTTITRNSNTFTINGTTYTLKGMAAGTAAEGVTVTSGYNADKIVDTITGFVKDYNDLLGSITDKIYEERDKDYQPLTKEQKDDLSDEEVETWNSKAKIGWLRNDIYLSNIASSLRSSLYAEVRNLDGDGNLKLILPDIGITTGDYTEEGKLTIDEDKLRTALAKDTEGVIKLFNQQSSVSFSLYNTDANKATRFQESGLFWRINDIIKTNTNAVGAKSALVDLVGNPSTGYIGSYAYSERIGEIDLKIKSLKVQLEQEREYYYKKFTAMETAINSLNAQSSYLFAQSSSY